MGWVEGGRLAEGDPTTLVCLDYLRLRPPTGRVLDYGCGDGVLGRKAAETASSVDYWDIAPVGVEVTKPHGTYDLVLANIISGTLIRMAPELMGYGGELVLSGIRTEEAWRVAKAFKEKGEPIRIERDGWVALCYL